MFDRVLRFGLLIAVSFCVAAGCGRSDGTSSGAGSNLKIVENGEAPGPQFEPNLSSDGANAVTSNIGEPEASGHAIVVKVADRAGLNAVIASHAGRVVLVDYWGTWCAPCRKKFPHTVALARKHRDSGLSVVSVALDDDEQQAEVEQFLVLQEATFDNLRSKAGASDAAFEMFDIPNGALPCLRVFDRSGKLRKTFAVDPEAAKQFTFEDVAAAVTELLAEKL